MDMVIGYDKKCLMTFSYFRKFFVKLLLSLGLLALALSLLKNTEYDLKYNIKEYQSLGVTDICGRCYGYTGINLKMKDACKKCFTKVVGTDLSKTVRERNNYLLEYHKKSKQSNTSKQRLPDIIGIGVRKCGTGWLQHAMLMHPLIKINKQEVHYFTLYHNYKLGINYYRSLMPSVTKYEKVMEKTPTYFNFPRWDINLPEVIRREVPNAKLWLILCDPTHRALSDYIQVKTYTKKVILPETFENYVEEYLPQAQKVYNASVNLRQTAKEWQKKDFASIILTLGVYYPMMKEWMKYYTEENLHIISGEEMIKNPGEIVEKLQEFLELPKLILAEDFVRNASTGFFCISPTVVIDSELYKIPMNCMSDNVKGKTRAPMSSKKLSTKMSLQKLKSFFQPYDEKLFQLLDRRLW